MYEKVKLFLATYGKVAVAFTSLCVLCISLSIVIFILIPKKLRVSFLDIGQGDAILIQTPSGHSMLIDGGPNNTVLARLSEEMNYFDHTIDVMVATHGDADHVTGLIPVLEKYDVQKIIHSPIDAQTSAFDDLTHHMKDEHADMYVGQQGDVINLGDGVVVHILYPGKNISPKAETNDASVSMVLTYGDQSFLLTGDLPSKFESKLFNKDLPHHITVYKAGHHGSKTSSGIPLLIYTKPEYSIISAGKDNKYGHPNPETLERLQKYSQEIISTIDRGTITFVSDGKLLELQTQK